jgi:hypothetical protein
VNARDAWTAAAVVALDEPQCKGYASQCYDTGGEQLRPLFHPMDADDAAFSFRRYSLVLMETSIPQGRDKLKPESYSQMGLAES